mmetsp:Transcript_6209/g.15883  ORF Transcript_6209/g.15883 Transcript_6209/m.15883 type:complete len:253 (+) Transcript_6209:256-1014(+)
MCLLACQLLDCIQQILRRHAPTCHLLFGALGCSRRCCCAILAPFSQRGRLRRVGADAANDRPVLYSRRAALQLPWQLVGREVHERGAGRGKNRLGVELVLGEITLGPHVPHAEAQHRVHLPSPDLLLHCCHLVEFVQQHAQEYAQEEDLAKQDNQDEEEDEVPTASAHASIHDGVPVLARHDLEDRHQGPEQRVKVCPWYAILPVEMPRVVARRGGAPGMGRLGVDGRLKGLHVVEVELCVEEGLEHERADE